MRGKYWSLVYNKAVTKDDLSSKLILDHCVIFTIDLTGISLKRVKRNLSQFAGMIRCATGRSALDYNGYGCWCGRGGSGTPVDATDS